MSARPGFVARRWLVGLACSAASIAAAATPDVCTGSYHSMALRSDGRVLTWGWDGYGQLGIGRLLVRYTPAAIDSLANIRTVSSRADAHILAVTNDGRLYSWGDNEWGTLGDGTFL